jgi:hypothetical protein
VFAVMLALGLMIGREQVAAARSSRGKPAARGR